MRCHHAIAAGLSIYFFGCAQLSANSDDKDPCSQDMIRLCPDVNPGVGGAVACLKAHESELSSACKQKAEDARDACQDDAKKFCAAVKGDVGLTAACLKRRSPELSQDCKASLQHIPATIPH